MFQICICIGGGSNKHGLLTFFIGTATSVPNLKTFTVLSRDQILLLAKF